MTAVEASPTTGGSGQKLPSHPHAAAVVQSRLAFQRCVATLAAIVVLATCGGDEYGPLRAGDPVTAFATRSLAGDTVTIGGAMEDVTLVNVWATWCIPCREEMPALQELHETSSDRGLRVIGINIDTGGDGPVGQFLDAYGITYLNLRDPSDRITPAWRLVGVPETFLIDRDGRIVHRWIGRFDPASAEARDLVEDVLTGGGH